MATVDPSALIPGAKYFSCYGVDETGKCRCGKPCHSPGKHPATSNGFYAATDDPKELVELLRRCPTNANLAMATGQVSDRVFALDADVKPGKDGIQEFSKLVRKIGQSIDNVTSLTGSGGIHALFRAPLGV